MLSSQDSTAQYEMPGYVLLRQDRKYDKVGGGLITYIANNLNYCEFPELAVSTPELEAQTVSINYHNCRPVYIVNVYRPPSTQTDL